MTYEEIIQEINEILDTISILTENNLEDTLYRLDDLAEFLEKLINDNPEDDLKYQETVELLEEARYLITQELDSRINFHNLDNDY